MNDERLEEFDGLPVVEIEGGIEADVERLPAPGDAAWGVYPGARGWTSFDAGHAFDWLLENVDTTRITHLVIGWWDGPGAPGEIAARADVFPRLRALYLGDIPEQEISWIGHGDISPIFAAFPELERLEVQGVGDLGPEPVRSESLRVLRFESGGLPAGVVRAVAAGDCHGSSTRTVARGRRVRRRRDRTRPRADPRGERLPALRHLGLQDSVVQDDIAEAVAGAPVVARLESLSLAMGTLSDRGAEALLSGQPLTHLRKLDLNHHFISEPLMERIRAELPGVDIDLGLPGGETLGDGWPPDGFYVAVSE
ncbi:leucine-rich repeat domain-containing protein [Actinomadura sp. WMMB 499]|uniref:leucine-rich repeat domain-containing protein n=1 Tax=Actinomadura sp. WMMB 499 TaxID=1219491 RepID=UPI00159D2230